MGRLPILVLLCCVQVLVFIVSAQETEPGDNGLEEETTQASLSPDCREETYPCTRMYSVHQPIKRCIHSLCLYSLPRVYVINKEICVRIVCQQEEILKADLCRERSGWPKRAQRSLNRCHRRNARSSEREAARPRLTD
ncbi:microfibril associated protein 5 [Amia ocellicauda]|uniref:microfibril associated protein 5 n=1 Tax=Amia ocellicauda TaxID=2972642 RepID=UPI003464465F